MARRITKEIRALLPAAAGMLSATVLAWWLLNAGDLFAGQYTLGNQFAAIAFILGVPLIAAASLGSEFDHRTLPLLLAQPVGRGRLWVEKWVTMLATLAAVLGLRALAVSQSSRWPDAEFPVVEYVGMIACSAPLWTLAARSTIGGFAFAGAMMMTVELATTYAYVRLTGQQPAREVFAPGPVFNTVRILYAAVTLACGYLLFTRFEASGPGAAEQAAGSGRALAFTRPRSAGAVQNLVRKELMLQRTTFMIAGGFVAVWLVATTVVWLLDLRAGMADIVFPFILLVHIPVTCTLAGTMSNSEERSLGVHAWHLTLPVPAIVQWRIKFGLSMAIGILLGLVIPATLAALTAPLVPNGHASEALMKWQMFLLILAAIVIMFWASTVFGGTVRAAVAVGILLFIWLVVGTTAVFPLAEFASRYLAPLVGTRLLGVRIPRTSVDTVVVGLSAAFALAVLVPAAAQSFSAFRRVHLSSAASIRISAGLLGACCLALFVLLLLIATMDRLVAPI